MRLTKLLPPLALVGALSLVPVTASSLAAAIRLYESVGFRPFLSDQLSARCDQAYFLEIKDELSP